MLDLIDLAFPPADTCIRDFLLRNVAEESYVKLQCRYLEFIIASFTKVEEAVKTLPKQTGIPDLASAWREYIEANRKVLYTSIVSLISVGSLK